MLTFAFKHRVRSSLWFIPVTCVLLGVLLSIATIAIDRAADFELVPKTYTGGPEAALSILSLIAGAMVNLAVLVLTITMVVVQLATGQYSPRIVRPFVQDRPSQIAIGMFVATFAHALLTMREVTSTEADGTVPGLSIIVAFVLVVASIIVLVVYVHHIGQALTVAGILESVSKDTQTLLGRTYGSAPTRNEPDTVRAVTPGALFRVDHKALVHLAAEQNCVFDVVPSMGEYVPINGLLCRLTGPGAEQVERKKVRAALALGSERTMNQDVSYGFRMLVDIAVRSASEALADPTTTVQAIDRLHDALRQLAVSPFPDGVYCDDEGVVRVRVPVLSWTGFVHLAFDEIRQTGLWSPQIVRRLYAALLDLKDVAPPDRQAPINRQTQLIDLAVREKVESEDQIEVWSHPDPQGYGSGSDLRLETEKQREPGRDS